MTDFDFATFEQAFLVMNTAHQRKRPTDAYTRSYFTLLAAHPIADVVAAGQRCLEQLRSFPKPADWLAEIATRTTAATCPPDRRTMHADEADDLARATAMRFEDAPCGCVLCYAAGVTDRPLRFMPTQLGDDDERAFNMRTGRVEIVGHWAHGEELARWYLARDRFYALKRRAPRALLAAVNTLVGVNREPGEEG